LLFGSIYYRDYMRLYLPKSVPLASATGWDFRQQGTAYDSRVWAGFFFFSFPGVYNVTFEWTVPHAAVRDGKTWHYDYLIQHQAGWTRQYTLVVTVPAACSALSAQPLAVKSAGAHSVHASFALARDEDEVFQYQC